MSASLTAALTSGVLRSASVMNALEEVVLELEDELEDEVAPPPMYWPTDPLIASIVPLAGAVSTAATRLFCAVCKPV